MKRCSTRKWRYRDRIGALIALSRIQQKDKTSRGKTEQRAYRCPECHGWHLMSQQRRGSVGAE